MKKLLLSMMALAVLTTAEAKKVKFRVDMTGQTVNATRGVSVAGNFQSDAGLGGNWTPSTGAMTREGSTDIYSLVVDLPANRVYEFKFVNGNDWNEGAGNIIETIPAIMQVQSAANGGNNGNRWFFNDSTANDTAEVFHKFSGSAPTGKYAVRFTVNLKNETVASDGVFIAGDFTNWGSGQRRMANLNPSNKIYEYIAMLDAISYQYKFKNGDAGWESVPGACAVSTNRSVTVSADAVVTEVCLGSCGACLSAKYSLMFQVDLSNSCDPYDSVTVSGAGSILTGFGPGLRMTEIGTSKIFVLKVDSLNQGEVKFKFRSHKNGGTNWEGGPDRAFDLAANDTVDLTCFGSRVVGNCPVQPAPSTITFKVDITDTIPGVLFVMGTFKTPNWQAGAIRMTPSVGQPGVFEATVQNICPGSFNYKFVNAYDGDSSKTQWEETFKNTPDSNCIEPNGIGGFNRKYTRANANSTTLYFKYNSCAVGANVGINEPTLNATYKLYPNPAQTYTTIEFNDRAASHDVVVMDITGKVIVSLADQKQNAVVIPTDGLSKGIYFIKATNTRNESVTSKLIVR